VSTQPSDTLVSDLQIAIKRLARRSTVMNIALQAGMPLFTINEVIKPVGDAVDKVRSLLDQAIAQDVDLAALRVQIDQPISDELAGLFDSLVSGQVPDDIGGLL